MALDGGPASDISRTPRSREEISKRTPKKRIRERAWDGRRERRSEEEADGEDKKLSSLKLRGRKREGSSRKMRYSLKKRKGDRKESSASSRHNVIGKK